MYQEYPPCQLLAPYIDKYWEFKGETEYDMHYKILPDGCTDFIFSIGEPSQPLNGEMLMQPYRFYFVGPMRVYSELVTRSTRLHMMGLQPVDPQIIRATDLIVRANGMLPIQQLTDKLYIGQRHFERKFKHITGYTPKEFSRITKFRYATRVLRQMKGEDMQQLAIDCGYYDPSHFIKEFRKLSGSNPSAFMALPIPEDDPLTYIE